MDLQSFYGGNVFDAYMFFGAHVEETGVTFRVFAPNATKVLIEGDFNQWNPTDMVRQEGGIYMFWSQLAEPGMLYKYVIVTSDGALIEHADPYGFSMELRPNSASRIVDLQDYTFTDEQWMSRRTKNYDSPMNIYELHMGSWRMKYSHEKMEEEHISIEESWYTYDEIAEDLIAYVTDNGYTHIEIMPLSEHPADCSWGYQNTGFFAPTSRYGSPVQLKKLIDQCHKAGIGVITDFVPVHFAVDAYGLASFDGTTLYEYPHKDVAESEWGTYNFMYSRGETRSFMQSAANYWLSEYHFDGIRMDAISRAIYWQGQPERGVNDCAVEFIKNMNTGLHAIHPTAILIAEDSTNFTKVTAPTEYDGLGFDYKWDMGWMNDTLDFLRCPPEERHDKYHKLTFSMAYFYNELYLLPFSHDEVVHGKATIVQKMWGLYEDKFKQARTLYLYMMTHPGKKLNFMGNELGQFREWDETREQDWELLQYPMHDGFHKYMKKLMTLYGQLSALYNGDYNAINFKWLEIDAPDKVVYVYRRNDGNSQIITALNFSNQQYDHISFPVEGNYVLKELIHSDNVIYGGTVEREETEFIEAKGKSGHYYIDTPMPPFSGILWEVIKER